MPNPKQCTKCYIIKDEDDFNVINRSDRGLVRRTYCKDCHKETNKLWNRNHPEQCFSNKLKWYYNLTIDDYNLFLKEQDNSCASCGKVFDEITIPHIDHDHRCCAGKRSCGKCVRGLLCNVCNRTLGSANDNVELLQSLVSYVSGE